ncbi:MAG: hypothetical protein L3J67_03905 [Hyphomicrobiaceae bacterium]|nr:hypothetical protein [Hyphomicrobiaceae bacterium]
MDTFVLKWPLALILIFVMITAAAFFGISKIEFDDKFTQYFDHRYEFRVSSDYYEKHISGSIVLDFSLPAAKENGVFDETYLADLERFTKWLRQQKQVSYVDSFVQIAPRLKNLAAQQQALAANAVQTASPPTVPEKISNAALSCSTRSQVSMEVMNDPPLQRHPNKAVVPLLRPSCRLLGLPSYLLKLLVAPFMRQPAIPIILIWIKYCHG